MSIENLINQNNGSAYDDKMSKLQKLREELKTKLSGLKNKALNSDIFNIEQPKNELDRDKFDFRTIPSENKPDNNEYIKHMNEIVSNDSTPKIPKENKEEVKPGDDAETKKMIKELASLKRRNQMYLDKISRIDKMTDKLKKQKGNDINKEYEQNLVNEITKIKPKGVSEGELLNKIKNQVLQKQQEQNSMIKPVEQKERKVKSSEYSMIFKDFNHQGGRYGILTRIYFENKNKSNYNSFISKSDSCYVVLNSKTLTVFESQSTLNILANYKTKFVKIKDLVGTNCFFINHNEDDAVPGITLCALNSIEKEIWVNDIQTIKKIVI